MAAALLEVEALRAGFGPNAVLHGVDFEVREGEIAALLGLNGAGKSVTMKVVGGFVPAWGGQVRLRGDDITTLPAESRVARGMAHVPQGRQLFPELTVEENLRLGAYLLRRRDPGRYPVILARLFEQFPRLAERRTQMAGTLSGGEQAMLAVARALVAEPALVLIDEPSAGLAPIVAEQLFELLREVNASGVTMLLVEQNVTLALRLAHRAHIMQRGQIVQAGAVDEIDQQALAGYLGIGRLLKGKPTAAAKKALPRKKAAPKKVGPAKKAAARKAAPKTLGLAKTVGLAKKAAGVKKGATRRAPL